MIIALLAFATLVAAESGPSKEYRIKAAFLYNFAQFVEWPSEAFADERSPLTIGILGEDPFGTALDDLVKGETLHGRPLAVRRSARAEDLKGCQILFIDRSEKAGAAEVLTALDGQPVLTVSDLEEFARRGGAIRLFVEGKKVRFEINQEVAQSHHLKLSAQLLSLGKIVGEREEERK